MAIEYRLSHTASEIDRKLTTVDEVKSSLENNYYTSANIDTKIDEVNASLDEVNASLDDISASLETRLSEKADLVDGKIPADQLPDDIGSGGGLTEVFWEDVKDKPFYDTRIRSYYSQAENPNPPQIDNAMMNMSCYKVSDLVPTRTEIFNSTKVIVNGTEYMFAESGIQLETDDFVFVGTSGGFGFIFVNKSGTLNFTASGYPMSIEVPEGGEGIYYQRALNAGVPAGRTIEFIIGGELKQIDPKFIPADLDFNLDDYYTKSEVDNAIGNVNIDLSDYYTKDETYSKSELDEIIGDIDSVINEINILIGE